MPWPTASCAQNLGPRRASSQQQQFRIFTHRHTPESLPTVHCSRGSDPPAEALCGSRIWGCGRKSWLLCCGPQDGGGLGRQPRPNPLGPLAEAWLAQREVCRRAMAGVTREIRIRRAGRGESDLASCAGAPPASQAVPRAPGLSSRWPTRQSRRAPTAHACGACEDAISPRPAPHGGGRRYRTTNRARWGAWDTRRFEGPSHHRWSKLDNSAGAYSLMRFDRSVDHTLHCADRRASCCPSLWPVPLHVALVVGAPAALAPSFVRRLRLAAARRRLAAARVTSARVLLRCQQVWHLLWVHHQA